ncbi:MAG: TIGR00159 family protein [bacterium]|nr:TIGR00159 family protein [bacterium]MCP5067546.1 TIGR00159 family protein [bacterium]
MSTNFDPVRDTLDILVVSLGIYWLLLLLKGTRAIQILLGLLALLALRLVSDLFDLVTLSWILENFLASAVLIIIVLFQADIRRVLARVGRGVFPRISERQESQILEEVVRASRDLAEKRVGALVVLERDTGLEDMVEVGTAIDSLVTKELLTSIFLPYSPIHDGAVIVSEGRVSFAGCILPLALTTDLPDGVGTRHRAALGITEETDAVVVVVSEETGGISVVVGGKLTRNLSAPMLRVVLRDLFSRESILDATVEDIVARAEEAGEASASGEAPEAAQTR